MRHKIIVDSHEPDCMRDLLKATSMFDVSTEVLPIGDYIIDRNDGGEDLPPTMYFSLKSFEDCFSSIKNDHLHNEIYDLLSISNDKFIALIVWGRKDAEPDLIEMVEERVATINAFYLPVFIAEDRQEAIDIMVKWTLKCEDKKKYGQFPIQYQRRVELAGANSKYIDPTIRLYMNLAGVDKLIADNIKKIYPKIDLLIDAIRDTKDYDKEKHGTKKNWEENIVWWHSIPLIAKGRAQAIEDVLVTNGVAQPTIKTAGATQQVFD